MILEIFDCKQYGLFIGDDALFLKLVGNLSGALCNTYYESVTALLTG